MADLLLKRCHLGQPAMRVTTLPRITSSSNHTLNISVATTTEPCFSKLTQFVPGESTFSFNMGSVITGASEMLRLYCLQVCTPAPKGSRVHSASDELGPDSPEKLEGLSSDVSANSGRPLLQHNLSGYTAWHCNHQPLMFIERPNRFGVLRQAC